MGHFQEQHNGCHLQTKDTGRALKGFNAKKHEMHQRYSQRLLQTKQTKAEAYLHNHFLAVICMEYLNQVPNAPQEHLVN